MSPLTRSKLTAAAAGVSAAIICLGPSNSDWDIDLQSHTADHLNPEGATRLEEKHLHSLESRADRAAMLAPSGAAAALPLTKTLTVGASYLFPTF